MKGLAPLFLGIFGTFAFSWVGLTLIPNWQIGHLDPQMEEDGSDAYPQPQSGMVERGARVYAANGCIYCHSQQVRADYAADDIERKWGGRRSAPRDYIFERPVFLGKMRMGQDLSNIGARAPAEQENAPPAGAASPGASPAQQGGAPAAGAAPSGASPSPPANAGSPPPGAPPPKATASSPASPAPSASPSPAPNAPSAPPTPAAAAANASPGGTTSVSSGASAAGAPWPVQTSGEPPMYSAAWHHVHLYSPRSINVDSNMPSYRFLYQTRRINNTPSDEALKFSGSEAPSEGWEIIPTYDAKCLVAYLISLNQSHPLKEVRSAAPAASPPSAPKK
jgi:cbb3-type cytochrome oxidase cytochrome c subunit